MFALISSVTIFSKCQHTSPFIYHSKCYLKMLLASIKYIAIKHRTVQLNEVASDRLDPTFSQKPDMFWKLQHNPMFFVSLINNNSVFKKKTKTKNLMVRLQQLIHKHYTLPLIETIPYQLLSSYSYIFCIGWVLILVLFTVWPQEEELVSSENSASIFNTLSDS